MKNEHNTTLCPPKNRTCVLWSITYTNIGHYQCHLTELFTVAIVTEKLVLDAANDYSE